MININYDIWKEACDLIKKYAKTHGKFYLQLYPFYNYNNLNTISSESFFNSYVSNGAIFTNYSNFDRIDNYCRKSDGSYRNRFLLSPIIYIYYISIGLYFSKKYNQKRNKNIYVEYGASFDDGDLHYRNSYHKFVDYIVDNNSEYNYYYKLDISDFFNKIDIDLLTKLLANSLKFNQKEQMLFKEFIKWCGNGTFPQTECGVTSCYLATIVYFDIIDNKLYNSLIKEKRINKFKICRYVDDLYILLDIDGRINTDVIENRISSLYENLIYSYGLSINREKSKFNNFDNIFSDLKSFSIFEDYDEDMEIPEEYKHHLLTFLTELGQYAEKGGINYQKYINLIDKYFDNPESKYHAGQILYVLIYKNIEWLKETKIIKKLTKIIENDFNVLSVDPRRLVSIIVNTHDEEIIKKFLNKLYCSSEEGNWLISHNFMTFQYLLYRNFASAKLLNKMRPYCSDNVDFIIKYYKEDWRKVIISKEIDMQISKLKYNDTPISFFKFLEIISLKNGDILKAQAYNKNYFDSITKNIELVKGYSSDKNKVNYRKGELKDIYINKLKISNNMWNSINDLCDRRNKNPLCHASCNVFSNKQDISISIVKDIKDINDIVDKIIEKYI